ncbi:flagellar hook-length control protein FliK [Alloalcanivorax marinus]|uniref:flagellar hook-length control protein FliK n=1 Tax=Alloalcanivorax marinus TaxID=1177169 RepID=UPI001934347A|nr:flagellar hook-length control protein FliK [Alloalcanivorax marinus]
MSGITPILDTLLHQVLGKRVDVPLVRPQPDPVRPLLGAEALTAVRSDSRLDPRALPAREGGAPATEGEAGRPPPAKADPVSGSTRTHFSPAARTIADLLARYPAPPSAVRQPTPLMPAGQQGAPELATRLRGSLEQSGLFYESHLQGWFQGRRDAATLVREPQMRVFLEARGVSPAPLQPEGAGVDPAPGGAVPARPVNVAAPTVGGSSSTTPSGVGDRSAPGSTSPGVEAVGRALPGDEPARSAAPAFSETQRDVLHGVLRHQLEMLAAPVLRWEGDVWSGIFMALMIQLPEKPPQHREHASGEEAGGDEAGQPWRTGLTLSLPALGEVRVRLALERDRLDLTLGAAEDTARRLRAGSARLRERLVNLGLGGVHLRVVEEGADER